MNSSTRITTQYITGILLRGGLLLSLIILIIGVFLGVIRNDLQVSLTNSIPVLSEIFVGVVHFETQALLQLGIMLMLATPIFRVFMAWIEFIQQKDKLYTILSFVVLLIIVWSVASGLH